ncbi:MAG: glycosyltransferase [Paludibacteraceae bacterium]|nr:glycosyltransferase [Paludibacteraceae bacterium]
MKIVIVGTAYPFRGGLATFNQRLAQQFQAEGHHVELITFTTQYPSFLFPGKTQYSTEAAPADLTIRRAVNSCNPLTWWRVGRQLHKQRPDFVICCYWMAFFAPAFATIERIVRRNRHTRCIALVHNMIPHEPTLLDKLFAPAFVRNTDGFVALSQSVLTDIAKLGGQNKPKACSPHPIYDHYGEPMTKAAACQALSLAPQNDYMLFFGLVRAYKGLDLLIDAFAQVKDKLPRLRLLVAGEFYEDEQKYREQIAAAGLTERVIIRNEFIPDADLRKYFGAADLIVQPYKSATQSGVTQVAFHFEKPMLVTNVGGLSEIVHHGKMGYAVPPQTKEIAAAISDYYTHNRQESFTGYLRLEKDKYGWDKLTQEFLTLRGAREYEPSCR